MKALRRTAIHLVALIALQGLWLETSHSQSPGSPGISEEISKQEAIYQSRGQQVPDGYTTDRGLSDYVRALPSAFDRTLANLGPNDRWLDIGAGEGRAILDYYSTNYDLTHPEGQERRGSKAQTVAISIEDRRTPLWDQTAASLGAHQLRYSSSRRLREYSLEELGRFQLITDVIGGFSYTTNLSLFMEKVLSFLEVNGSFHTLLQDVQWEGGSNRPYYAGAPFLTEIANTAGSEVKVCSWLKSITCVKVRCESKADWRPPIEAFHVQKICNDVTVPPLEPLHYQAGTPPERRFQLVNRAE